MDRIIFCESFQSSFAATQPNIVIFLIDDLDGRMSAVTGVTIVRLPTLTVGCPRGPFHRRVRGLRGLFAYARGNADGKISGSSDAH